MTKQDPGTASNALSKAVDDWTSNFPMYKQGEWDAACGAYCLLAAIDYFEARTKSKTPKNFNRTKRERDAGLLWLASHGKEKWDIGRLTVGGKYLTLSDLVKKADTIAGLTASRGRSTLKALDAGDGEWVHIILVEGLRYPDPATHIDTPAEDDVGPHFLVVLQRVAGHVVVADSHPWIPSKLAYAKSVTGLISAPARSPYHVYAIKEADLRKAFETGKRGTGAFIRLSGTSPSKAR